MARSRYGDLLAANNIRRRQSTQSPYGTTEKPHGILEVTASKPTPYGILEVTASKPTPSHVRRLAGRPQSTVVATARVRKRKRTR